MLSEGAARATGDRHSGGPMACLLKNEPASHGVQQVKGRRSRSHSESESEEGVQGLHGVDPKPGELSMARVKRG